MCKEFGYPEFDSQGEMILTGYDGDYSHMMMDVRIYQISGGMTRTFLKESEETAVLLLRGRAIYQWQGEKQTVSRKDVFTEGAWCLHVCRGVEVSVTAEQETEILVQCTHNDRRFSSRMYRPEDAELKYFSKGKYGDVANRRVSTIVDKEINPDSNFVLGEILNDRGNWSGFLPHRHPQPELYYFMFDHETGFGASFSGDNVYKIKNRSFAAIPGGNTHPQAAAPGYVMYTCWMIRHFDDKPWLQTDRCVSEEYLWLDEQQK